MGALGKGKRQGPQDRKVKQTSKAVWVGGMAEGTTYQELLELGKQVGDAIWAKIMRNGSGAIGFRSEEDAASAVAQLSGVELRGAVLEVDAWTPMKKEEEES